MLDLRLLGPVELRAGARRIDLGPPQRRAVLAALGIEAGRPVPIETLVDRVWGDRPAQGARRAVHAHVTRIRRLLEEASGPLPVTLDREPGGYVLRLDPDRIDVHAFRRLTELAMAAEQADVDRAALLGRALALWRGEPLADIDSEWAARARAGWQRERLDAVLAWAAARLRLGESTGVIGQLADLTCEHPYVEPLAALLMRALHGAGRTAEALEVFAGLRRRLVTDLGTEPGPELRRLHEAMLRHGAAPSDPPGSPDLRRVPLQLPADVRGFTGRRGELALLDDQLAQTTPLGAPVVITVLTGTAGVGKTTLAVHWAHRVRGHFPDGQLFVDLRGFTLAGSPLEPTTALRGLLDALGVAPGRIPAIPDSMAALYRSVLAGRRVLIVLDNARDSAQVRPLLPGSAGCFVLVTSRERLAGLVAAQGATTIELSPPGPVEAGELLAARLEPGRAAAEPAAVEEIVRQCARLPLALSIAAAYATGRPGVPLLALASEVRDAGGPLEVLTTGDPATELRAVFSWSYRALPAEPARVFRAFGLHPGPDLTAAAAASLAGLPMPTVHPLLTALTRANLLVRQPADRYTCHDLLRVYAADLAHQHDTEPCRMAVVRRVLEHYLHSAEAADRRLNPAREPRRLPTPGPLVRPERFTSRERAQAWFDAEHQVLMAAIRLAAASGFGSYAGWLVSAVDDYLDRRGHWHDRIMVGVTALSVTDAQVDPGAAARVHRRLAHAHARLGDLDEADEHLREALEVAAAAGDVVGLGHTHVNLAYLWGRRDRPTTALDHARQALRLYRTSHHRRGEATVLNKIGWYYAQLGRYREAVRACEQALALHRGLDDRYGQAATWDSLGYVHHYLGDHDRAVHAYRMALTLLRDLGDGHGEADTLLRLGDTYLATGGHAAAREAWQDALTILDLLDHPDAELARTRLAEPVR